LGLDEREGAMKRILTVAAWMFVIAAAVDADAQAPRFTLTGLVVVEGGGRAWLQEPALTQNQPVALRPGESIGPYRLTKIFDDRVEMVGPAGPFSVLLAGVQGPATTTAATPPPAWTPPPAPVDTSGHEVVVLPPGPPLAPTPPGTPRVDFGSLLRGISPQ
jgi:hypothetical protein